MKQQKKLHEVGPRLKYLMRTGMAVVLVCQSQSTTKSFIHHRLKEFPNPNPTTPSSSITLVYDQFQNINPKLCPCPVIKNGVKNKKCEKCVQLTVRDIFLCSHQERKTPMQNKVIQRVFKKDELAALLLPVTLLLTQVMDSSHTKSLLSLSDYFLGKARKHQKKIPFESFYVNKRYTAPP